VHPIGSVIAVNNSHDQNVDLERGLCHTLLCPQPLCLVRDIDPRYRFIDFSNPLTRGTPVMLVFFQAPASQSVTHRSLCSHTTDGSFFNPHDCFESDRKRFCIGDYNCACLPMMPNIQLYIIIQKKPT